MSKSCQPHKTHQHEHKSGCGHTAVIHEGHTDYLHDGHLHHIHDNHVDEHLIPVDRSNPDSCGPGHSCSSHDAAHVHNSACGHQRIPHGDHFDYVVDGHLHYDHDGHCDDHGLVKAA